jgi:hypothetical protein
VIDEAVGRLGEIEGCRGMLELCPVDFINLENVLAHPRRDESLKIKLDAYRRRMQRLVLRSF